MPGVLDCSFPFANPVVTNTGLIAVVLLLISMDSFGTIVDHHTHTTFPVTASTTGAGVVFVAVMIVSRIVSGSRRRFTAMIFSLFRK
jgi:hypothetical protein